MSKEKHMEWNVYYYNHNQKRIAQFDIFKHTKFEREVREALAKIDSKGDFSAELNRLVGYYYWSKAEWETVITPWVGDKSVELKIDVADQIRMNWFRFVDYVWSFKGGMKNVELDPCPFCGGEARVQLCDGDGNYCGDGYLADIGKDEVFYGIAHDIATAPDCPIAMGGDQAIGALLYGTPEEVAEAWNRRTEWK